jgi:3-hydroxyacyl-CoA dehydrogenase
MENMRIKKIAVIGSGVMGAQLAALFANCDIHVLLYDIVPEKTKDRSVLAKNAIESLKNNQTKPFFLQNKALLISPCNLSDDLELLKEVDWILEAVTEKIEVKEKVYKDIAKFCNDDVIISSNTSTIPVNKLAQVVPEKIRKNFLITHFFNPPRYMALLEIVKSSFTDQNIVDYVGKFADKTLGKTVINCHDTAGFIANRIGCYFLEMGAREAINLKITPEEADVTISSLFSIPKTGIFGLFDLIGLDVMKLISSSLTKCLPKQDEFVQSYYDVDVIEQMIANNQIGRKVGAGFYKLDASKQKLVMDLKTGEYSAIKKIAKPQISALEFCSQSDKLSVFARNVIIKTINYAAIIAEEIADSIYDIDEAMKSGYHWQYGPFEILDMLSNSDETGCKWAIRNLIGIGVKPADLLLNLDNSTFYKKSFAHNQYLNFNNQYQDITIDKEHLQLAHIKLNKSPIMSCDTATLWDIEDGVNAFEFTSKLGILDEELLHFMNKAIDYTEKNSKAMIIASDHDYFSAGANIKFMLEHARSNDIEAVDKFLAIGQATMMRIKYAHIPVIAAISGYAYGGGCEMLLHCHGAQLHCDANIGLVETSIGVIPGWGGCKELFFKVIDEPNFIDNKQGVASIYNLIMQAYKSSSAHDAIRCTLAPKLSRITMNRKRLIHDAKELALNFSKHFVPKRPHPAYIENDAYYAYLKNIAKQKDYNPEMRAISNSLIEVLSGNNLTPVTEEELLKLERKNFCMLLETKYAQALINKIAHVA